VTAESGETEAERVRAGLERELAEAGARQGHTLVWSAQETAVLAQIASLLDRKADLLEMYRSARAVKNKLKLSSELRLIESAVARLLREVRTDVGQPEGLRTVKARRAARARWDRHASG
jgi:hypothetical protein